MILVITPGDPCGIGPEVVWKTLLAKSITSTTPRLLVIGARAPFERLGASIQEVQLENISNWSKQPRKKGPPTVHLLSAPTQVPKSPSKKKRLHLEGYQSGWSIQRAVELIQSGIAQGLVTGPISKERLQAGGYLYPGHTEFLAKLCGKKDVTMMLANSQLRVTMVTTHLALKDVSRTLTQKSILKTLRHTHHYLRHDLGIPVPRIAVAGLNPHAGEGGLFGKEEVKLISPAIKRFQRMHLKDAAVEGPLPADTLFANHISAGKKGRYDAVVCMYHDQGLIPVKLLDFPRTVNVTLGLPLIRTSVDHGTGFDIAGLGRADPSSFQSALQLAEGLIKRRVQYRKVQST